MSRLLQSSFERGDLLDWTTNNAGSVETSGVILSGVRSLRIPSTGFIRRTFTATSVEYFVGFFLYQTTATSGALVQFRTGAGTTICAVGVDSSNRVAAYRGDFTSGTLLGTGTQVLTSATIYHIQVHVVINAATGVVETRIDGNADLTLSGQNTGAVGADVVGLFSPADTRFDDVIINDALGSTDNTWPGIRRFTIMTAAGVGTYVNNWSRNTGSTNWQAVDEVPNDSDTTYLFTTTPSLYESFSMLDHGLANADIRALITSAVAKKDSGTSKLIVGIVDDDNATNYMTPAVDLGTSYGLVQERRVVDPSSGIAWTLAGSQATQALIVSSS